VSLAWQEGLFGPGEPGGDRDAVAGPTGLRLDGLRRARLDVRSWVDVARGAYADHGGLFDLLLDVAPWRHRTRRIRHRLDQAVVVTLGLGERRAFWLRPGSSGGPTHRLSSGQGDLVVMGGRCQHEWQHTVPKASRAGARMSVTMRHSQPLRRPGGPPGGSGLPPSRP
jgi:hypothetical protein